MRIAILLALVGCGRVSFDVIAGGDVTPNDAVLGDTTGSLCTSRLVAHWPFDEVAGSQITDLTGDANGVWTDGNDNDVVTDSGVGHSGRALTFGTGRSVVVVGFAVPVEGTFSVWLTSTFDDTAPPAGASHWMVVDAPGARTTISYADQGIYALRTNGVNWQTSFASPVDLTTWFHLAATWSATGSQLYLDGVPVGVPGVTDARAMSDATLFIGTREQGARWWDGQIDDMRFFDYAMNASGVAALRNCP